MSDWTSGYVADIGYTFGYYNDLNPLRVAPQLAMAGLQVPKIRTACELGFGQGMSINLHAAASEVEWHGTDFNPSQAAFAQELSAASGAKCHVFDQSFEEFCARPDLPDFDYIGLHGIWSWISDENRSTIVDFVRRKLTVGGVLYISYNTLPGWANMVPVRNLMTQHAEVMSAPGVGITKRIDAALEFVEGLVAVKPGFLRHYPQMGERIKQIKSQNRNYVAHEYFNRDWAPMSFTDMTRWLEPAKLSFAASSHFLDSVDAVNMTSDQQKFLGSITSPILREQTRDFICNTQFRRDFWVRGPRALLGIDRIELVRNLRVMLVAPREDVDLKISGNLGEATLNEGVYKPYLDLMADHQIRSISQIAQALDAQKVSLQQIVQATQILLAKNSLAQAQTDDEALAALPNSQRINAHLCRLARTQSDLGYLASPVLGGGFPVPRFHQLMLAQMRTLGAGAATTQALAAHVWQALEAGNQRVVKDGKALQTREENIAELTEQAQVFISKHWPILKALKV